MARFLPVSNGRLFVAFDEHHRIHELTYPHVGKENHAGPSGFRNGLLVDGVFRWITAGDLVSHRYKNRSMTGQVVFAWKTPREMELVFEDWVDLDCDVFFRNVTVRNRESAALPVTLFFHQDFLIQYSDFGDTAVYLPEADALLHYKDERYFLVALADNGHGQGRMHSFACGKRHGNQEGTWKDAEDGVLSGNPIAQGAVDSIFSVCLRVEPGSEVSFTVMTVCGTSRERVFEVLERVRRKGSDESRRQSEGFWNFWIDSHGLPLAMLSEKARSLYEKSLLLLRTHWDSNGAVVAAIDSESLSFSRDTYAYLWPRDAAMMAYALDIAGFGDFTRKFYGLLPSLLSPQGFLHHKYHPSLSIGSSWHPSGTAGAPLYPIQIDETALPIWALYEHFDRYRDLDTLRPVYHHFVLPAAQFLSGFRDHLTGLPLPSYDLWEERAGVGTHSAASVYAGLLAASRFAEGFGDARSREEFAEAARQVRQGILKHLFDPETGVFLRALVLSPEGNLVADPTPDSSIAALFQFGVLGPQDERMIRTMDWLERMLWVPGPIGGMARYENDYYYRQDVHVPGNPWVISTLWLLQWKILTSSSPARDKDVRRMVDWVVEKGGTSGMLPEQVHPLTGARLSVSPLAWSHAEWVIAVSMLAKGESAVPHPWDDPL
ncbi:glycoside hydrolase family 15 protein [Leptospirillum ferriphilum]|jgi:glucoamylase|uniref:Putative glycoside hydrolase, family 15 n=1 Tax=Leptospirillum sp. Group II '5-way CG' TaxID=419541 RepID=B6ARJ7_9BACT|nr:MAG: Putative glycoside hydrolase, family 15 [Leptospirillum sp. Group II '5-way CG']